MTLRWLERINERVSLDVEYVFPTAELLDHVPLLIDGIASFIENPGEGIGADDVVIAKAMELGALRFAQGFGAHEVLKEYEILGGIIFNVLVSEVDELEGECTRSELLSCGHRLFQSITAVQQATTTHYLRVAEEQVREREDRLRSFNRLVTHELKNRITAAGGAAEMLREEWIRDDEEERERFLTIVTQNVKGMQVMLQDILAITRTSSEPLLKQKNVELPAVAREAARQLREMAEERGVEIRLLDDLPSVEVDSAAVELCLVNYISNGIKYSDPSKQERWVEVAGYEETDGSSGDQLIIEVRDNGVGVPEHHRDRLFEQFYRAHDGDIEGTGLGLSIVRETVESIGGRAWATFDRSEGCVFKFSVPIRRDSEVPPFPRVT